MVYIVYIHLLMVLMPYKSFPDVKHINRWLTDDAQMINLALHRQMVHMVQMVRCSDVRA